MHEITKMENISNIVSLEVLDDDKAEKYLGGMFEVTTRSSSFSSDNRGLSTSTSSSSMSASTSSSGPISVGIGSNTTELNIVNTGSTSGDRDSTDNQFTVNFIDDAGSPIQTGQVTFGNGILLEDVLNAVNNGATTAIVTQGLN